MSIKNKIMSMTFKEFPRNLNRNDALLSYRMGYRDARQNAAKIATTADACIDALRDIVEQQLSMGFDGSPSECLMSAAKCALADVEKCLGKDCDAQR